MCMHAQICFDAEVHTNTSDFREAPDTKWPMSLAVVEFIILSMRKKFRKQILL
jgi:hypothetical protein